MIVILILTWVNKYLEVLNTKKQHIYFVLEKSHIHIEVKKNIFNHILHLQTNFKNNILDQCILDNI